MKSIQDFADTRGVKLTQLQVRIGNALIAFIFVSGFEEFFSELGTGVSTLFQLIEDYFKYDFHYRK